MSSNSFFFRWRAIERSVGDENRCLLSSEHCEHCEASPDVTRTQSALAASSNSGSATKNALGEICSRVFQLQRVSYTLAETSMNRRNVRSTLSVTAISNRVCTNCRDRAAAAMEGDAARLNTRVAELSSENAARRLWIEWDVAPPDDDQISAAE